MYDILTLYVWYIDLIGMIYWYDMYDILILNIWYDTYHMYHIISYHIIWIHMIWYVWNIDMICIKYWYIIYTIYWYYTYDILRAVRVYDSRPSLLQDAQGVWYNVCTLTRHHCKTMNKNLIRQIRYLTMFLFLHH